MHIIALSFPLNCSVVSMSLVMFLHPSYMFFFLGFSWVCLCSSRLVDVIRMHMVLYSFVPFVFQEKKGELTQRWDQLRREADVRAGVCCFMLNDFP
jgi:hypothetical protein